MKKNKYLEPNKTVIEGCVAGDRKAQFEVYSLYSKAMYNVCVRIVNNLEEAEDILQEAFLNAFKNINNYNWEAAFGAWLKRIVVNLSINHIKKKRLDTVSVEDHSKIDQGDFPDDGFELELSIEKVYEAIQQLPDGYRVVFSLYLLEGYDHGEIAQILEINESTSKSQFNRAKKKLREILSKD